MNIHFAPEAKADLWAAAEFYELQRTGLAVEFLDAFELAFAKVTSAPLRWPELEPGIRRYRFSRFPYALIYRLPTPASLEILAVFDLRRQPGTWRR